jgi:hypothetical protein
MVPIVWRQQLIPASQDELCPLVSRGNADERVSLQGIMHHLLSELGRVVYNDCCRGRHKWRRRITKTFSARTCGLLRFQYFVRHRYIFTSLYAVKLVHTATFSPSCPRSHLRDRS